MFEAVRIKEKGIKKVLGHLEAEIMEIVWKNKKATVKEMHRELSLKKELAYTTIMTVADRLYKKGFLKRTRSSASYVYEPVFSREQFQNSFIGKILKHLFADFKEPAISFFVKRMEDSPEDAEKLMDLMEKIKKMKKGGRT
ncbi:MAG: BlaI/MecI/CopY family transcriptional regulator [Candidatus Eremiobacteraeota bacterium]|jgi:predicted transcriptional regulator|nr:BlaI/MecI/CopY family transcriptional regulator [Candidatus Eremiobacteraeota bacterium]MCL5054813.1 BlaI/MecI/CopY family transcriptional regulator [Bacillota bacterium]